MNPWSVLFLLICVKKSHIHHAKRIACQENSNTEEAEIGNSSARTTSLIIFIYFCRWWRWEVDIVLLPLLFQFHCFFTLRTKNPSSSVEILCPVRDEWAGLQVLSFLLNSRWPQSRQVSKPGQISHGHLHPGICALWVSCLKPCH